MKRFLDEDFLLTNDTAIKLYHGYAKDMPIFDYHCHLGVKDIYENKKFKNLTEVWLYGDHYKWKAMRSNGIDERFITGDSDDFSKFMAWAQTVPMTIGNPLYQWTHLELKRYFGITEILNKDTALKIWGKSNSLLNSEGFGARDLIKKSNVKVVCTTNDPTDSLEYHIKLRDEGDFDVKVLPAFRPDKGIEICSRDFIPWIGKLESVTGKRIRSYDAFLEAMEERIDFFHAVGCRLSDHAIDSTYFIEASEEEVNNIFKRALNGETLTRDDENKYRTYTLKSLGAMYHKLGWAMQLHIGAMRNINTRMYEKLGPDTGFDAINDYSIAYPLVRFLDSLEVMGSLPKVILYTLNPADNYILSATIGCFQSSEIPGKIQFGSAWWINDHKDGMTEQLKALANVGLLSRFVGMLTDSRSFLSYTRHEYFRRVLCNLIGEWVEDGEAPDDLELLGEMVQNICFNNARRYFGVDM